MTSRQQILEQRAVDELRQLAADLHVRGVDPLDIADALHERTLLLAQANGLRILPAAPFIQELDGLADWDFGSACRASAVATWLNTNAGLPIADSVASAALDAAVEHLESGVLCG
jgi:hypothetical protein